MELRSIRVWFQVLIILLVCYVILYHSLQSRHLRYVLMGLSFDRRNLNIENETIRRLQEDIKLEENIKVAEEDNGGDFLHKNFKQKQTSKYTNMVRENIVHVALQVNNKNAGEEITGKTENVDCIDHVVKLPPTNKPNNDRKKRIVWFDAEHNGHGLRNSANYARFRHCKGVARNCKMLPHHLVKDSHTVEPIRADAVIFQGCHLPILSALKRLDKDQVFVLAVRENWWSENAYNKFYETKNRNALYYVNKFNWTMTYRYDSDILFPYGYIIPKSNFKDTHRYTSIYKNKRFEVAWLVSHCSTGSNREQYVNRLRKHISVHIYGECGSLSCPKGNRACLYHIIKTHKFVLSFENTYHTNYVTEKLFNWFPQLIVPVVRGGETDYSRHGVPTGTIINADAFEDPKALAMYLRRIGSDEEKYTTMLKKKAGFKVISKKDMQKQGYCKLCGMLNTLDDHRQYYNQIGGWFSSKLDSKSFCKTRK